MNTPRLALRRVLRLPHALLVLLLLIGGCTDEAEPDGEDIPAVQAEPAATDTSGYEASTGSLVDVMREHGRLDTLVQTLDVTGLAETMQRQGPFTIFAPSNAAFDALPEGTLDALLQQDNRPELTNLLTHHVVDGRLPASELKDGATLTALSGELLEATVAGEQIRIGDAAILQSNLRASNGIVHIIDQVLTPGYEQ